jgi:uncharacterized membrane protein YfcA
LGSRSQGHLDTRLLWTYGPLLAVGGLAGALLSARLPGRALLLAFAVVTSAAAFLMLVRPRPAEGHATPARRILAGGVLLATALLGGVIGLGAAFLIIPVLLYVLGTPPRVAAGSSMAMSIFLTLPALAGKALTGQIIWFLAAFMAVTSVLGSRLGAHLSIRVPSGRLRVALAILVGLLAARLWLDLLTGQTS